MYEIKYKLPGLICGLLWKLKQRGPLSIQPLPA